MPATTQQECQASVDESPVSDPNQRPERSHGSLSTLATHLVDGEQPTDTTRIKAEAIARCIHSSPIEELPAEIIELIAKALRDQAMVEEGAEPDDFYKAASELSDSPPPCKCQEGQVPHHATCYMRANTKHGSCEPSISLSSTSKRLRQVVFDDRPFRLKVTKYCVKSLHDSAQVCDSLRGKVR